VDVVARRAESVESGSPDLESLSSEGPMITLHVVRADDWERWRDMRLNALSEAPEAFCSTLSDWEHQSEQAWRDRLTDVPANFIAVLEGDDAGMVSAAVSDNDVELIGMWVAPFARGRGVGDELVRTVVDWSLSEQRSKLILRVLNGNDRAATLYQRHGFEYQSVTGAEQERLMVHTGLDTSKYC
jgi:RimJ/RimL family protein N-acetyltransferase